MNKYMDIDSSFKKHIENFVKEQPVFATLQNLDFDIVSIFYDFLTSIETSAKFRDILRVESRLYDIENVGYDLNNLSKSELISLASEVIDAIAEDEGIYEREVFQIRDVCYDREIPHELDY